MFPTRTRRRRRGVVPRLPIIRHACVDTVFGGDNEQIKILPEIYRQF